MVDLDVDDVKLMLFWWLGGVVDAGENRVDRKYDMRLWGEPALIPFGEASCLLEVECEYAENEESGKGPRI